MFNIDPDGNLIVDPNILPITEIKKIWDWDKSKTKDKAVKVLSGIYFLCNPKSPFAEYREADKKKLITEQYFQEAGLKGDEKMLQDAIKLYSENIVKNSVTVYLLQCAIEAMYLLGDKIKDPNSKINDIQRGLEGIKDTMKNYTALKDAIDKGALSDDRRRGNRTKGSFEDPDNDE